MENQVHKGRGAIINPQNKFRKAELGNFHHEGIDDYEVSLEDYAELNPRHMKYIDKYKEIKDRDGHTKVLEDLKGEVKSILYDKREMIKLKNPRLD